MKIWYAIVLALLVVDPMYACMPHREGFRFGVDDVEPALRGTWHATWTHDGRRHAMRFRLRVASAPRHTRSSGLVRSADACGTRSLIRPAGACATSTFVSLDMELLDEAEGTFQAMLYVGGHSFTGGVLNLWLGHSEAEASATISRTGEIEHVFKGPALNTGNDPPKVQLESLRHVKG